MMSRFYRNWQYLWDKEAVIALASPSRTYSWIQPSSQGRLTWINLGWQASFWRKQDIVPGGQDRLILTLRLDNKNAPIFSEKNIIIEKPKPSKNRDVCMSQFCTSSKLQYKPVMKILSSASALIVILDFVARFNDVLLCLLEKSALEIFLEAMARKMSQRYKPQIL